MSSREVNLKLRLSEDERLLLLEAVRNQREFVIEDGYMPEYVDKFIALAKKVGQAVGGDH